MATRIIASFDIGGTNMRAAVVAVDGRRAEVLEQQRRPTPSHLLAPAVTARERLDDVIDFMVAFAEQARRRAHAEAVAAAFPGPLDAQGRVAALPTLWGSEGASLCPLALDRLLAERLPGLPVRIYNDVSAAGFRFVAEHPDFALFTLGSGVGLKVFIDGQPQVGPHGRGGELTHMVFDASVHAPLCDCGGRGHLGALASGRAWQRRVEHVGSEGPAIELDAFAEPLARAVAMIHYTLGMERFLFAGGLAEGLGEPLRAAIVRRLPAQGWQQGQDWNAMIRLAPADDAHALIGGALAFAGEPAPITG
ncbi:MAG TPA: ROK family protein [Tahibacter sp.]|uniref:ROK family protein n=1 Tax=Tahibacter sp. TaxID=2056211 RepID=UPI002BAC82B9|nr:ROK family protein [Tahibacter sp.]HSX63022.1 ROK family protein [Tahibacter sp.]